VPQIRKVSNEVESPAVHFEEDWDRAYAGQHGDRLEGGRGNYFRSQLLRENRVHVANQR